MFSRVGRSSIYRSDLHARTIYKLVKNIQLKVITYHCLCLYDNIFLELYAHISVKKLNRTKLSQFPWKYFPSFSYFVSVELFNSGYLYFLRILYTNKKQCVSRRYNHPSPLYVWRNISKFKNRYSSADNFMKKKPNFTWMCNDYLIAAWQVFMGNGNLKNLVNNFQSNREWRWVQIFLKVFFTQANSV